VTLLSAVILACHTIQSAAAEETVILSSSDGRGRVKVVGEVLDYKGPEILLRRQSGKEERFDSSRLLEIQADWAEPQAGGEKLFAERRYEDALGPFRAALQREPRMWVRRHLLARCTVCYRETNQWDLAGGTFAALVESDPQTPYLDVMPLNWGEISAAPASMEGHAAQWLASRADPLRLLGASWLLGTAQRSRALETLQTLTTDAEPRVALLAAAQMWRVETLTARGAELDRWEQMLERLPESLRSGPYFVLAEAQARQQQAEAAALNFLRVPIHYPHQKQLAAEALWRAASQLEILGKQSEAETLYREILAEHGQSPSADRAQRQLAEKRAGNRDAPANVP
jgi:hypothetical protein